MNIKEVIIIKSISYENHSRKILANNIIYYRLQNKWSQEDFADKLETTSVYVSNLENAKRNTRINYIGRVADTLGVSVKDLFEERTPIDNHKILRRKE